jgi:hypothetical protein
MNTFYDILERAERDVSDLVRELTEVSPEDLGLDRRAGYRLYISEDGIIARMSDDRVLQYYGGFEYVDKDLRWELGKWVFYSAEDERVQDHLDHYKGLEKAHDEEPVVELEDRWDNA